MRQKTRFKRTKREYILKLYFYFYVSPKNLSSYQEYMNP